MKCAGGFARGRKNAALATIVIVLIFVLTAAAIAGSAFFLTVRSSPFPTTTTIQSSSVTTITSGSITSGSISSGSITRTASFSSSTTNSISSTTSSGSTTSSSTSIPEPLNAPEIVTTWKNYLGNFSAFTVEYNESNDANSTFSYHVLGQYPVKGTALTEVNLTVTTTGSSSASSLIGWFNPEGNATMITEGGYNFTGSAASNVTVQFASAFEIGFFTPDNLAIIGQSTNMGTNSQSFGSTELGVTSYAYNVPSLTGESWNIQIGNLPGTNLYLLTRYVVISGTAEALGFQLVSLTRT